VVAAGRRGPPETLAGADMRVGSLFTGYGGLDMAINGDLAWYCEIEPAACRVLEAHYPGVPNLGDITKINWDEVEPVDIITGGYPCQPFSTAGHRKGKDDERHLWPFVRDAIRTLRPRYAILENVAGHLTLGFADVLADLAAIGWDAEWTVVRASDVGACHRRERLFILAHADSASSQTFARRQGGGDFRRLQPMERGGQVDSFTSNTSSAERRDTEHAHLCEAVRPATESGERVSFAADTCSGPFTRPPAEWDGLPVATGRSHSTDWGQYTQAIHRWENTIGRPAPNPTIMGRHNKPRLNPEFVEWMMGLPSGWVTGHNLSPAQCLKMLGNGVVPQQARYAIQQLTERTV
jgi:DNA (cytosine-5)-methyltransferase 1